MSEYAPAYTDIVHVGDSKSGKTKIYEVRNAIKPTERIGTIRWNGERKQYTYFASMEVYDQRCLWAITKFLERINFNYKT